jgi:uncharacterized protein (TIGR02646 family)
MEKITKPTITDIPSLKQLADNYVQWGKDFKNHLDNGGKSANFTWKSKSLYTTMRSQLSSITKEHCSFCDGYPVADKSKEGIEHYFPKNQYPLKAYDWMNLFYCCDKCQSESTKKFEETLKPDDLTYQFDFYFYFDLGSGEIKVIERLKIDDIDSFIKATAFIVRYGINSPTRTSARKNLYQDICNYFIAKTITTDVRERDDFQYRYIFDFYLKVQKSLIQ